MLDRKMTQIGSTTTAVITTTNSTLSGGAPFQRTAIWYATTVMLCFMIVATIFGNSLVLVTTWLDKRLHQPNKYFIACLAVADLFIGVFSIPIRLDLQLRHDQLAAIELCRFWMWLDIFCVVASVTTLEVISIDRYFKISQPFKYRAQMRTSKSVIVIFVIWLISSVHATIGMFPHGNSRGVEAAEGRGCIYDNKIYLTVTAAVFFFLPSIIMIVMYSLIFYIAHERKKMARNGALGRSIVSTDKKRGKDFFKELKTIRILFLVVSTFICCWFPFFIHFLLINYKPESILRLSSESRQIIGSIFVVILPSFNSLCNPIIYACFDREYSGAFKQLFQRMPFCNISGQSRVMRSQSLSTQTFRLKDNRSLRTSTSVHEKIEMQDCQEDNLLCNTEQV